MPYARPTLQTIKNQALSDITTSLPVGGYLLPHSYMSFLVYALSGAIVDLYGLVDYYAQNAVPWSSSAEYLEAWAALKNVTRVAASFATGTVTFTGVAGTVIPAGTSLTRADGVKYVTAADYTVGVSPALTATATTAGAIGNHTIGTQLALGVAIAGVSTFGTSATAFVGGADTETDDAFRTRMLLVYGAPSQGGNANDYLVFALGVPGITRAWINPLGAGAGSVVVYVMLDSANVSTNGFPVGTNGGATAETRIAAATGDQLTVANALFPLRPVSALVYVAAPTAQAINISIQGLTPSSVAIKAAITANLQQLFLTKGTPLGGTVYISDINGAIESATGVGTYTLLSPATNVTVPIGYLATLGNVVYS